MSKMCYIPQQLIAPSYLIAQMYDIAKTEINSCTHENLRKHNIYDLQWLNGSRMVAVRCNKTQESHVWIGSDV